MLFRVSSFRHKAKFDMCIINFTNWEAIYLHIWQFLLVYYSRGNPVGVKRHQILMLRGKPATSSNVRAYSSESCKRAPCHPKVQDIHRVTHLTMLSQSLRAKILISQRFIDELNKFVLLTQSRPHRE